jgi:hypothetical protein
MQDPTTDSTLTQLNARKVNAKQHLVKAIQYILINLIAADTSFFWVKGTLCSKQVKYLNYESHPTKNARVPIKQHCSKKVFNLP